MQRRTLISGALLLMAGAIYAGPQQAAAAVAHRYSFTTDASDSVGGANGTVVDAGVATAVFAGGQLDLSANNGQGSNGITEDAYVNFPNGIISAATNAGTAGQLTLEFWTTATENRDWAALFSAGTSGGGEDSSSGGGGSDYIQIIPRAGNAPNTLRTTTHRANVGAEGFVNGPTALSTTQQTHIVSVYNQSGGLPGTVSLYVNGSFIGTGPIATGLNLGTFVNNNVWIGRSQWPDSVYDGKVNEFRVYNHALTNSEALGNAIYGPDVLNTGGLLHIEVNKNTGAISLVNAGSAPLSLEYYRISSDASALNLGGWNSLDAQGFGAVDGPDGGTVAGDSVGEGWDKAGGSDVKQLVEQFLGENGSTIGANQTLSLGTAFNPAIFGNGVNGDLQFEFGLNNGALFNTPVVYVTGGGQPGDFNTDGRVDGADFLVWQRGFGGVHNAGTLATWKANYGAGAAAAAIGAVPEPATFGLLAVAGAALAASRRKR